MTDTVGHLARVQTGSDAAIDDTQRRVIILDSARNQTLALINEVQAVITGDAGNDIIMCWENGLGILIDKHGAPQVLDICRATAMQDRAERYQRYYNGKQQLARLTFRRVAATIELGKLEQLLALYEAELSKIAGQRVQ